MSSAEPREAIRDRGILRRADWHVLLPVPEDGFEHMVLLGGPKGLPDAIAELGFARRVSATIPAERSADVVAVLHDAKADFEQAAACLVPGGTFYWEVASSRLGAVWLRRGIRRALRRGGLSMTGLYWARPGFDSCEVYVPAEVRTAMEWSFRRWADSPSRLRRLAGSRAGAAFVAGAIGPFLRRYSVTAVAGSAPGEGSSILSHPAVPADFRSGGARPLVLNRGGRDGSRRVVVFPFREGSPEPLGVLKFSRLAERNVDIREEQKIAATLRSRLCRLFQRSIPAPLGIFPRGHLVVGVETYAGRPISEHGTHRRRRRIKDLCLSTNWLKEFHRHTMLRRDPFSKSDFERYVDRPLAEYAAAFGADREEQMLFERVRRRAGSLVGSPFPLVYSHWAFSEFNVCRSGDDISVIDWETVNEGPPLVDLIYFLTIWHYRSRPRDGRAARVDSFERLFFPSGPEPLAALASRTIHEYMDALSIDPAFFPVMLVLTWVVRALARLKREQAFGDSQIDPRAAGNHVAFLQVLAKNQERLFPERNA